jgi:hypothetical protein
LLSDRTREIEPLVDEPIEEPATGKSPAARRNASLEFDIRKPEFPGQSRTARKSLTDKWERRRCRRAGGGKSA